ncbi:MAG: four helix bundle protein [Candidatus Microgenomates bacterium]
MKINKFEDLEIWQLAIKITKFIYDITSENQFSKDFELKNQIRKASISISSCIVEGFEKNNNNEFKRFLEIAKGSCGEVRNQLFIALTVGYINKEKFEIGNKLLIEESSKLGSLINYLKNIKSKKQFLNK